MRQCPPLSGRYSLPERGCFTYQSRMRSKGQFTSCIYLDNDIFLGPSNWVRSSFAVRYLQAGGDVFTLQDLLGHQESAAVKRFLRISDEGTKNQT